MKCENIYVCVVVEECNQTSYKRAFHRKKKKKITNVQNVRESN